MLKQEFFDFLHSQYTQLKPEHSELIAENLISTGVVRLPKTILDQAKRVVKQLFALREDPIYQQDILNHSPGIASPDPGNKSICMSYDFHVNSFDQLKLIEVNTNASFLPLGRHLYDFMNISLPVPFELKDHIDNIAEEHLLAGHDSSPKKIYITDYEPEKQRLFIEFLIYKNIYSNYGIECEIKDVRSIADVETGSFIYNRHTDFYLEHAESSYLREIVGTKASTVSPHPHEYALLADKERLIDWSTALDRNQQSWAQHLLPIKEYLLGSRILTTEVSDTIWKERKKYFLKPLRAFGSKQSFRGESITKGNFAEMLDGTFIAQEYCHPPEQKFLFDGAEIPLKYDLRFFTYKAEIQLVIARLYQGQVTNLKTPQGGFACVEFF